jgi:hypothetical protein
MSQLDNGDGEGDDTFGPGGGRELLRDDFDDGTLYPKAS